MKKFFKRLFLVICCLAIAFLAVRFGPALYYRFFGSGNTEWISERFSEELKEKNELVVFETTLTGQETASQKAWLIGKVQEVIVPYSYSISFVVDLSHSDVSVNGNTIEVRLPAPKASYSKLTVDEAKMKKYDWLFPLTPEHYAQIKTEIENKLFDECASKQEYLAAAWESAEKNMAGIFKSVAERSAEGVTCDIKVIQEAATPVPSATEAASQAALPQKEKVTPAPAT